MNSLYLSRLIINLRRRDAQRDLGNCYAMHQRLMTGFPDVQASEHARERFGVLYRMEPMPSSGARGLEVLVQSLEAPDWSRLPASYLAQQARVKDIAPAYAALRRGTILLFRLRANPTRRISERNTTQTERWRGKRVDLRREEDQLMWLRRKGEAGGFQLLAARTQAEAGDVRVEARARLLGRHPLTGHSLTFGDVMFQGRLVVADAERFAQSLTNGIGHGKAFGFGLLSVAPAAPPSV